MEFPVCAATVSGRGVWFGEGEEREVLSESCLTLRVVN